MLDAKEIEIEIARLEYMDSSYPNYAKLADLYAIRNEMNRSEGETPVDRMYSGSADRGYAVGNYGHSDFLEAIADKNADEVWRIINDLMDTLKVAQPKAYNSIMMKINAISDAYSC